MINVLPYSDDLYHISQGEYSENEYGQKYAAWEKPVFSQDRVEFPHYYFYHTTFPAGDGKTFYLLNHESSGQEIFTELIAYNLNNRVYSKSFTFFVDINDRVVWETVAPEGESVGKLQRNPDELGDETVTFSLLHSGDKPTEGQLLDLRKALRENLDAIGRPYAIGLSKESEDDSFFAIKTLPDRMNTEIAELLSGSFHLAVRSGQYETSVYSLSLRLEKAGENGLTLSGEGWLCRQLKVFYYTTDSTMVKPGYAGQSKGTKSKHHLKLVIITFIVQLRKTSVQELWKNS